MIVPMKKVSLLTLGDRKSETLKKLRKLGILHIEITEHTTMAFASTSMDIAQVA